MSASLRWCAALLVIVNLMFVQVTEAADPTWLVPMYLLAAASPWLARLHEHFVYRAVWNLAVLGIFALLVQHATTGLHQLLEDGLRLAAISQVHLVCNLGRKQRPDLLFFNSFLIAVVTAFLTQAFAYSAVFLLYAPALILALVVHSLTDGEGRRLRREQLPAVARDVSVRTITVLAVTIPAFLFLPRDFDRRGVLGERLSFAAAPAEVDFQDEIELGRQGDVTASDKPVFEVELVEGTAEDVPAHWRGATMTTFDGRLWSPGPSSTDDRDRWRPDGTQALSRPRPDGGARLAVRLIDRSGLRVFVPPTARWVEFDSTESTGWVQPHGDGTLEVARAVRGGTHRVRGYTLELAPAEPEPLDGPTEATDPRDPALQVPRALPDELSRLVETLEARLPTDPSDADRVRTAASFLAREREYLPPGAEGAARSLAEFAGGARAAHCEYFASTLALVLRMQGVPTRVVTGYVAHDWNTTRTRLTIRRRDAHAWVEVRDAQVGWYTVDPTPAAFTDAGQATTSWWDSARSALEDAWSAVVHFGADERGSALTRLASLEMATALVAFLLAAGGVFLVVSWVRGRTRARPASVVAYERAVARCGHPPRPGETPREFVERMRTADVAPARLEKLVLATTAHEASRYACAASAERRPETHRGSGSQPADRRR